MSFFTNPNAVSISALIVILMIAVPCFMRIQSMHQMKIISGRAYAMMFATGIVSFALQFFFLKLATPLGPELIWFLWITIFCAAVCFLLATKLAIKKPQHAHTVVGMILMAEAALPFGLAGFMPQGYQTVVDAVNLF